MNRRIKKKKGLLRDELSEKLMERGKAEFFAETEAVCRRAESVSMPEINGTS